MEVFYIKAFQDLNTGRENSEFGISPLSWKDIFLYAEYNNLDRDSWEPFKQIIRLMDNAYLEWSSEERDRQKRISENESKRR